MIVLEPDEAAVHGAARQDGAVLAFAAVTVPAEDVGGHLSGRAAPAYVGIGTIPVVYGGSSR
jgi:hypothetical protein